MHRVIHAMSPETREIVTSHRFQKTADILKQKMKNGDKVLEVGSTDATFRIFFPNVHWETVDKFGCPDINADLNDVRLKLPREDNFYDVVICTEVLEHLCSGSALITELARVLKPTGYAMVSVPNIVSLGNRIKWLFGGVPFMAASGDCGTPLGGTGILVDGHWTAGHVLDFNESRLVRYLARGGLETTAKYSLGAGLKWFRIPSALTPSTLADFVVVLAKSVG